jgi:hypothetical protein
MYGSDWAPGMIKTNCLDATLTMDMTGFLARNTIRTTNTFSAFSKMGS